MAQKSSTHTEVPAKSGFPPFQKETYATQLFWLALCFIVLYLMVARIGLPRIGSIIEQRRNRVAGDLAEAARLKGEADEAFAAYDKALADVRAGAQTEASETRDRLNAEADKRRRVLEDELNVKLAAAEQQIARTQSAAMANVRGIAIETAGAIVARLIGVTPPGAAAAEAVDAVLKR
jgi:F-type H+-transporting ATPase subunit b